MATASRSRTSARPVATAPSSPRGWLPGAVAAGIAALALAAGQSQLVPLPASLGTTAVAAMASVLAFAAQPAFDGSLEGADRGLVLGFGALCLVLLAPSPLLRIFPGAPLLDRTVVSGAGATLPITIDTRGHAWLDLQAEGALAPTPSGALSPVRYQLTTSGTQHGDGFVVAGELTDPALTAKLPAPATPAHVPPPLVTASHALLTTADRLTLSAVTTDPASAPPITVTVHARRLVPWPLAAAVGLGLFTAALLIDRRPGLADNDGALTMATGALFGAIYFFTTDNAAHPTIGTLIGAAAFGGALGTAGLGAVWWIVKRIVPSGS